MKNNLPNPPPQKILFFKILMDSLEDTQPINAMRLSTPGNIIQPLNQIKFREENLLNSSKIYRYLDTEQSFTKSWFRSLPLIPQLIPPHCHLDLNWKDLSLHKNMLRDHNQNTRNPKNNGIHRSFFYLEGEDRKLVDFFMHQKFDT